MFYSPSEKLIYESPTGTKYDPLKVHRQLIRTSFGRINQWTADWNETDLVLRATAEEQLVDLARTVFELKPFTEPDGHSDSQVLAILQHFLEYAEGKV